MEINIVNKLADLACVCSFFHGIARTGLGAFRGYWLSQINL